MTDQESPQADVAEAKKLLAEISTYITSAKEAIGKGVLVDLAGLDSQIRLLCDEIVKMPVGDSTPFREHLDTLSAELAELQETLYAAKDEVQSQIADLNTRQKAAHAYKNTEVAESRNTPDAPKPDSDE